MIRTLLVLAWIVSVLAVAGPPLIVWSAITGDARSMHVTARLALRVAFALAGVRLRMGAAGLEPNLVNRVPCVGPPIFDLSRNYVFMSNHVSNLDPPVCFVAIPQDFKIMFKKELLWLPILSTALKLARFIPVDRTNSEAARKAVDQAARQLRAGDSFLIFPEGTRSRDGSLGPFKSGGFIMAILSGVPVVPVTVRGSQRILPPGKWRLDPGEVEVIFHQPIQPPVSLEERQAFKQKVRNAIESAL